MDFTSQILRKPKRLIFGVLSLNWRVGFQLENVYRTGYYTLSQKKRRFNSPIFPVDPGSLTLTQGHVNFVKWSYVNDTRCHVHWYTLLPKRNATCKNLRFFWGWVYLDECPFDANKFWGALSIWKCASKLIFICKLRFPALFFHC